MTRRGARELFKGLVATTTLCALVVAPPILLARFVGWPLPHELNLDDIAHLLRGTPISDDVLIKALAVAGWVVWANALACLLAEINAWRRQRIARHVPLGGLFQPLISQLVLTAGLLVGTARSITPGVPHLPTPVLAVALPQTPQVAASVVGTQSPALPTCVVHRRDSLWVLAERHLGDGMRWREIYDLNHGQPQPGGRVLRDPNLILPGWTLRLPADAVDVPAPPSPPPPPAPAAPAPEPPPPAASSTTIAAPAAAPSSNGSTPTTTAAPGTTVPSAGMSDHGQAGADGDESDDHFPVPAAVAGATLLAAALVIKIDALRRRQMRRRPPGHLIPAPDSEAASAERLLRAGAARKPASRLDLALRLLAHQLATATAGETARIECVRVDGDTIEILLTEPVEVEPGPFEVSGGRAWTLPADAEGPELHRTADQQTSPAPALVTVGRLGDADVLVDLETESLTITGDSATAARVLWAITAELATSPWADDVQVAYVGDVPSGLDGLDRTERFLSIEDAATAIGTRHRAAMKALAAAGHGSGWSARVANHGDAWPPTIVVIAADHDDPTPIVGATVVRIAAAAEHGQRELAVDDGGCTLTPLGLRLAMPGLPSELIEPTGQLLASALSDAAGPGLDIREPAPAYYVPAPDPAPDPVVDSAGGVMVRVLGPVVIEGVPLINRRRVKELVVYLALHPEGVTDEQLKVALWPGDTPTRAAFTQTVSRARAALGDGPDGQPYISYVDRGLYRPSPYLRCDAVLLEQAASADRGLDGIEIKGQPFAASDGYEWAYVEGHAYRAAVLIDQLQDAARFRTAEPGRA